MAKSQHKEKRREVFDDDFDRYLSSVKVKTGRVIFIFVLNMEILSVVVNF